ncbi:MAG: hypothetical protein D4S01_05310 [Dehalococcoidia bacterium]|nr:MAG: hypothetical protein D4S01_05310 [Dehalococcoidia bacterium]
MKRILLTILVLSVASICYAADETEEITLTTYYPAPYGEYDELRTSKMVVGENFSMPQNTGDLLVEGKVGIGTDRPQGALDLQSTTSVFLPPRMTETERDNIPSPPAGSIIYNINDEVLNYHNGTEWRSISEEPACSGISESGVANIAAGETMVTVNFTKSYTNIPTVVATPSSTPVIDDCVMVFICELTNEHVMFDVDVHTGASDYFHTNIADNAAIHYIVISND